MNKPTHPEQSRVSPMQEGDTKNPSINRQEELTSLELEIEVNREGNNVNKGVANPGISKEEEVAEVAMEVQAESLEVTTSILDNIDILVGEQKKVFQQDG
jgi:hypothetical protein